MSVLRSIRIIVVAAGTFLAAATSPKAPAWAEDQDPPSHAVRAIRQGSEIEYLGEIVFGAADLLDKVLAENPHAKVLHLNSPGGEVAEAYLMVKSVEKRGLTTTVDKFCLSACTFVFLAGQQRLIAPDAKIGFHEPWVPGMSQAEMAVIDQRDRRYFQSRGVPGWFIDRAYSTPNSSIWYPTTAELTSANIITGVTGRYAIEVGKFSDSITEESFVIQQFMDAAKQRSPGSYQALHQLLLKEVSSSPSPDAMSFDERFCAYLVAFMAHAENRAVVGYVETTARILTKLAAADPEICYAALYPSPGQSTAGVAKVVGEDDARALTFAMMRGATSGARVYLSAPSEREVALPLSKVLAKLGGEHSEDVAVIEHPGSASHAGVCRAQAHLFAAIVLLPPDEQGSIARYFFAANSRDIDLEAGPGSPAPSSPASYAPPRPFRLHPDK